MSSPENHTSKIRTKKGSSDDEIYMYNHEAEYLADALVENRFKVTYLKRQDSPSTDGKKGYPPDNNCSKSNFLLAIN